jgi:hypothetical protein
LNEPKSDFLLINVTGGSKNKHNNNLKDITVQPKQGSKNSKCTNTQHWYNLASPRTDSNPNCKKIVMHKCT